MFQEVEAASNIGFFYVFIECILQIIRPLYKLTMWSKCVICCYMKHEHRTRILSTATKYIDWINLTATTPILLKKPLITSDQVFTVFNIWYVVKRLYSY